jgi:DNA polymerase-1
MSTLYLIDASVFIFRSYYAYEPHLPDRRGESANALFGYGMFLCGLLERRGPGHVAVAFDESLGSSFRQQLHPAYKANRPPAPLDLVRQFRACRAFTAALGLAQAASPGHEADDLIGALAC